MRSGFDLNTFSSVTAMTEAACGLAATAIGEGLSARGRSLALLSGGSTPLPLYRSLARVQLDWARVTLLLVDERWVLADHASSNERAVRAEFVAGEAAAALVVGLKSRHESPPDAVAEIGTRLDSLAWPADLVILGMGQDGHTASWFPNAAGLADALNEDGARVAAIRARRSNVTGDIIDRMTLSAAAIVSARRILLLATGDEKRRIYARARGTGPVEDMPVRALFGAPRENFFALWAP